MDLDLAQVRAFVAVVDQRHFGRAAQSLSLSQQALSKRIARLEARLGPLLDRRPGGVDLTAAGERLLPSVRQLLEIADNIVATARQTPCAPLRVDVWGELQLPATLMRAAGRADPELLVELSMRRDLAAAIGALQRRELDLAFGNISALDTPVPQGLNSELIAADTISALVNTRGPLAGRDHLTPDDLARHGIWWPLAGSSGELQAFVAGYARSIRAPLISVGTNLGLDAYVDRVVSDPSAVTMVAATWPLSNRDGVRVIPLRPAPQYPWYAIWRTTNPHPTLPRVLRWLRAQHTRAATTAAEAGKAP
ncbi:MAG TPA: LysR family transcriptional regulator [Micromonosporaceae bacterium]|nr:LysR family transcriptional regulator [Micromonosporaceae bacterium]